jgi:hypothetical protein
MRLGMLVVLPVAVLVAGCSESARKVAAPTAAATAPPAQTAVIRAATPAQARIVTVAPPTADVDRLTSAIALKRDDLPAGYAPGPMQGSQNNQTAAVGFADYQGVVNRMDATGRLGGIAEAIVTTDGATGAGASIDVWRDAEGCKQYFDQYPKPAEGIVATPVQLPHALGEQSVALQIKQNGQAGYSIAWRRGRLILGVGEVFPPGQDSLTKTMLIADALDKKAASVQQ